MARASRPAISVDPRTNIVRIHRVTLDMLGRPDYVMLLVNPENMQIGVRPSNKRDRHAHKVRWEVLTDTRSYEICSMRFISELYKFNNNADKNTAYRLYGHYFKESNVAVFDFKDVNAENVKVVNNA